MFERFTEKARRVLFFARYEASQFGSSRIQTEHLLLGLLREYKGITLLLPSADTKSIRKQIEAAAEVRATIPTSLDLPLGEQSGRVLGYAVEEAARLNHHHISTEHLLLGMLHERESFGARLLLERGADLEKLRRQIEKQGSQPFEPPRVAIPPSARAGETITIHDVPRNSLSIREAVKRCREYSWHWQKRDLTTRDIVVNRRTGAISFELTLAAEDPATFEVIKGGWKRKDRCAVCRWELFESKEDPTHGTGYTNGREWLCNECYDKFWQRPDFISGSCSDLT
jgi:ATP-dependent Clp protease ATP-binding subunit ClpA